MQDWNVVVSVHDQGYRQARRLLERFGRVSRTRFYNVLALRVNDTSQFLESLQREFVAEPALRDCFGHVMPVRTTFLFQSVDDFIHKACDAIDPWVPDLAGNSFHVRMHRRGFKGRLSSQEQERLLDGFVLERLDAAGTPGRITFDDPDVIIAVETIGQWAGLAMWSREERRLYPFFHLD